MNELSKIIKTDMVDETTINQVEEILNSPLVDENTKVRIMPDCHAGAGCVIGTTMTLNENSKICPNIVGVDIGCGMLCYNLGKVDIDLELFDKACHIIPSGMNTHIENDSFNRIDFNESLDSNEVYFNDLYCYLSLRNVDRLVASLGSLGGGNHFIELDKDDEDNIYLVIHSGSRNLGKQVAEYYQKLAIENCSYKKEAQMEIDNLIKEYKATGREKEISQRIIAIREKYKDLVKLPKELSYLSDKDKQKYFHDMNICQKFASLNRKCILFEILNQYNQYHNSKYGYSQYYEFNDFHNYDFSFETIHNYINFDDMILRKGTVSAHKGEKIIIPMNMRDGSLICIGKGNEDWNLSAPHGAGRILSRKQAKEKISLEDFKNSMKGIYSSTISQETIDESAMAYKPMEKIVEAIKETVEIQKIIKPIYNFKANE